MRVTDITFTDPVRGQTRGVFRLKMSDFCFSTNHNFVAVILSFGQHCLQSRLSACSCGEP